jgi:hypothetical protein
MRPSYKRAGLVPTSKDWHWQVLSLFICLPKTKTLDQELLKLLLEKVLEKFDHPQPEDWQDGIFILLS